MRIGPWQVNRWVIKRSLLRAASSVPRRPGRRTKGRVVVLCYHSIHPRRWITSAIPQLFDEQIRSIVLERVSRVLEALDLRYIQRPIQAISEQELAVVLESDLLFVDSSHVFKPGSDVQFLFEEVFPVLRPKPRSISMISSVPCDYPRDWYVQQKRFWNEAHHLENFLRFSSCFNVLLPVNFLARRSSALKMTCDRMLTCDGFEFTGSSFYVRRRS